METTIVSAQSRREYVQAIYQRYRRAVRPEKQRILDEFCKVTTYHRKHATRVLTGPAPGAARPARRRPRTYGPATITALRAIWAAAGYPWSLRVQALLPVWLPWARQRLRLRPTVEQQLLAISPRQMDRRLAPYRRELTKRLYGRTKPGTLLKHHIPLKTDRWDVAVPGFTEIDLVAHCGNYGEGEFVHALNLTDIHTAWGETAAVLGKRQLGVQAALGVSTTAIRDDLPVSGYPGICIEGQEIDPEPDVDGLQELAEALPRPRQHRAERAHREILDAAEGGASSPGARGAAGQASTRSYR
jgi:hypothetical protein